MRDPHDHPDDPAGTRAPTGATGTPGHADASPQLDPSRHLVLWDGD